MITKSKDLREHLLAGQVIPACPLPLDSDRAWSPPHQRALLHYYFEAGARGIAVGVHATQFAIRDPKHDLLKPVLELASEVVGELTRSKGEPVVMIAGVCGRLKQAFAEAQLASGFGYDTGLLSMSELKDLTEKEIIEHCRIIAKVIPLFGFYLQPAVGGRVFSYDFWRRFVEIPEVVGIKIAPFNRYRTWDVVRAVLESGRDDIALYTGNDDNIIVDLLTPFSHQVNGNRKRRFMSGGLLGQWGIWTQSAVDLLERVKRARGHETMDASWLEENAALTDANAAVFDAANHFSGCIPGIMEVLRRQGLAPSNLCLNPTEILSPGQADELDRVIASYPELADDEFIEENLHRWLG